MISKYIIKDGYYKTYIKDDLESFIIYFDYFSHGLFLPKFLNYTLIKKLVHFILRLLIIIAYKLRLYYFFYKKTHLNSNSIIVIQNNGNLGNTTELVKNAQQYKIVKTFADKAVYIKEKEFYDKYKDNKSNIKLPTHIFLDNNKIEISFLPTKSLQRLAIDGSYNIHDALHHFDKIKHELQMLYGSSISLIHGDLFLSNIFFQDNTYYVIDYADSLKEIYQYDLYLLLYSIGISYQYIPNNSQEIGEYSIKNKSFMGYLELNDDELSRIEKKYHSLRRQKIPNIYNS